MSVRTAHTAWTGGLPDGSGTVELVSSKSGSFDVSWPKRTAETGEAGTSPEELIAAAHSTCFSMALSHGLAGAGTPPQSVDTRADVRFQPGEGITGIHLTVRASIPGISAEDFATAAEEAKKNCPVSQALAGTTITRDASLV